MANLDPFFVAKIGQSIHRRVTTGNKSSFAVYARDYHAAVLAVQPESKSIRPQVLVHVKSNDITPSGMGLGGSDKVWGDYTVPTDLSGLEEFWSKLISQFDREMVRHLHRH